LEAGWEGKVARSVKQLPIALLAKVVLVLVFAGSAGAQYAYIATSSGISVINTATNTVTATVKVGSHNYGVVVNPAGTRVYVASQGGSSVPVIDAATNLVIAAVSVGENPTGVAVNPAGTYVYVANQGDINGFVPDSTIGSVSAINTATNTVSATVNVGGPRGGIAVNPTGTYVYVTNNNSVSVINTATNAIAATVSVGNEPIGVAVNPAGTYVYVANSGSNTVSVIDAATNTLIAGLRVGAGPTGVAINPAGTRVYVTNQGDNSVSVIDAATNTVIATVSVGLGPYGVAVNPAGTYVYVANNGGSGSVSVIDAATNAVTATVNVEGGLGPNIGNFVGGPAVAASINAGGIVNSASFAANAPVAPGSLVSVYGVFPVSTAQADVVPLPSTLSGLSMQFSGLQAPLSYVSPTQANVQVPWELAGQTQATVTATVRGQTTTAQSVKLASFAPGVFTVNSQGQGAIVNALTGQLIGPSSPARAGSTYISIYCTGLGPVTNQPLTGVAASASLLSQTIFQPTVDIGGVPASILFSGLAPTFVGLYQINVQVPAGAPFGDAVPLIVSIGGATANTVTTAVQPGS
jgi:uncharacterized protein (TIGR03437 family)